MNAGDIARILGINVNRLSELLGYTRQWLCYSLKNGMTSSTRERIQTTLKRYALSEFEREQDIARIKYLDRLDIIEKIGEVQPRNEAVHTVGQ